MKTLACILVRDKAVFDWVGHMPVVNWCVTKLAEVRGVHRTLCVATRPLAAQARKLMAAHSIETLELPDAALDPKLTPVAGAARWLVGPDGPETGTVGKDGVVLVYEPVTPFLPTGKIEATIDAVRRRKCGVCLPARRTVGAVAQQEAYRPDSVDELVLGLAAFHAGAVTKYPKLGTVPVNRIEALTVTDPDDKTLVEAMVTAGAV